MKKRFIANVLGLACTLSLNTHAAPSQAAAQSGYQMPSPELAQVVEAKLAPRSMLSLMANMWPYLSVVELKACKRWLNRSSSSLVLN